jgi:hypothetical protein
VALASSTELATALTECPDCEHENLALGARLPELRAPYGSRVALRRSGFETPLSFGVVLIAFFLLLSHWMDGK